MHHRIDCIDRDDNTEYHINGIGFSIEDEKPLGSFGMPKPFSRTIMNKYISDYVHNRKKKAAWKIKVY